jgi:hypothetical protein
MRIDLSRQELFICEYFGTMRRKNAMQFNVDRQVSKQNPYDMDIDGFKGEFIVAKYLNLMPDFTLNERKNPVDLWIKGKSIDVKATRNKLGNIYVTMYHKKNPCDYYIQTVVDDLGGLIRGWISGEDLFKVAVLNEEHSHPSYMLPQAQLKPIEDLIL